MDFTTLLVAVVPLVLFVIVDLKYGMREGILTAVITSIGLGIFMYAKTGELDLMLIVELALLVVLGVMSLKLKNSRFFKFQPTVVGVLLALYIAYLQIFSEPLLLHMKPMLVALNPDAEAMYANPATVKAFTMISLHMIFLFLIHAAMVAYAAIKLSNIAWITSRILIYPMVLLLMIVDMMVYGGGASGG